MKKILAVLLLLSLVVCFAACTDKEQEMDSGTPTDEVSDTENNGNEDTQKPSDTLVEEDGDNNEIELPIIP